FPKSEDPPARTAVGRPPRAQDHHLRAEPRKLTRSAASARSLCEAARLPRSLPGGRWSGLGTNVHVSTTTGFERSRLARSAGGKAEVREPAALSVVRLLVAGGRAGSTCGRRRRRGVAT